MRIWTLGKTLIICSLFFGVPIASFGQTASPAPTIQELVLQLQEQVLALQKQVLSLQSELEEIKTRAVTGKAELRITGLLERGARGDEVRELQEFLSGYPEIYPEGLVTGYFGPLTETAVKKLQEEYGIEAIGIVGPKTLAKLRELAEAAAQAIEPEEIDSSQATPISEEAPVIETATSNEEGVPESAPPEIATSSEEEVVQTTTTETTTTAPQTSAAPTTPVTPSTPASAPPELASEPEVDTAPVFTVASPNGGEELQVGSTEEVTWTQAGTSVDTVNIELYKGGILVSTPGYDVQNNGSFSWTLPDSLASGEDYAVRIYNPSAEYYANYDESDSAFSITVPDTIPPATPASIGASASSATEILLQWEASTDDTGVSGYRIYRDGAHITDVVHLSYGNSYTDTGLFAETTYSYTVAAYDAAGNVSSQSSATSATTEGEIALPAAPSSLNLSSNDGTTLNLRWTDNSDDETEFRMERRSRPNGESEKEAGPWEVIASIAVDTTTYVDENFPTSGMYDYRVKACNNAGCSEASNAIYSLLMQQSVTSSGAKNMASIMQNLSNILLQLQKLLH